MTVYEEILARLDELKGPSHAQREFDEAKERLDQAVRHLGEAVDTLRNLR